MNIKEIIGSRIKLLRKKNNLSQEKLAFNSGLDRTYISSVENGNRNISIENIRKITEALSVTIKDFFNDECFN
jgi:transcriptional regulator with XRE-family HTH domain